MSGENLAVDPAALTSAGTSFQQAGAGLSGLGADGPLDDAAAAVPQLATAAACRVASAKVAEATSAVAEAVDDFGSKLGQAAAKYETQDQSAAASIQKAAGR